MPTPSKHSRHPVLTALGAAIRHRRKACKLSQEQLAQAVGMDRSYIGQVERGENSVAILPLAAIASALETTIATLMQEAEL
ncbi:helix-turn-helix domain-containing protein [Pseudoduganella sp. FT26W]|uniref:Helix-turn-helix domain-containing protein n=1 Tax=Duganella aquatilis TaxID=2666082 RepID=A0A844DDA8_9BURK|nr:helix-turn-helix transcriptional regulator [Duganella aquatilis]MRW85679.1 helix-turn-helix domain-containing protein [Duganella aquatilis]